VTVSRRKRRTHRIPGASVRGARRTACRRFPIPAESGPGGRGRARCSICALAVCLTRPLSKPPPPVANEIAASLACGRRMMEPAAGVLPWGCQRQVGKPVRARGGRRPPALRRRGRCPCRKAEWPIFEW